MWFHYGHGPRVSPWARCAGTAFSDTVIVCGFSGLPGGKWHIVTLSPSPFPSPSSPSLMFALSSSACCEKAIWKLKSSWVASWSTSCVCVASWSWNPRLKASCSASLSWSTTATSSPNSLSLVSSLSSADESCSVVASLSTFWPLQPQQHRPIKA